MSGMFERLLARFQGSDYVIELKARFLLRVCIVSIFVIPLIIVYNIYLSLTKEVYGHAIYWPIIAPLLLIFIVYFTVILLIIRGRFSIAAHSFFIASQCLVWSIMFIDKSGAVSRLDTVAVVIAILSMSPLVISRRPLLIPLYSAVTALAAFIFARIAMPDMNLPYSDLADFVGDTALATVVVAIMTYNIFSINRTAMDRLAESNARLDRANEELAATNEELTATNEELTATNEEFNAQNHELIESQRTISQSLDEKNVLIKEIHHRVKNNMQIVSSLLSMQAQGMEDPIARQPLNDAVSRIRSMALIHEKLYRTENFTRIDISAYITDLLGEIRQLSLKAPDDLRVTTRMETIYLSIDQAIPCGILINEILTNSIKHGRRDPGGGSIDLSMSITGGTVTLVIADSGPGMDVNLLEQDNPRTLGMQLIKALANQLGADLSVSADNGTRFTVRFAVHAQESPPDQPMGKNTIA